MAFRPSVKIKVSHCTNGKGVTWKALEHDGRGRAHHGRPQTKKSNVGGNGQVGDPGPRTTGDVRGHGRWIRRGKARTAGKPRTIGDGHGRRGKVADDWGATWKATDY